MEAEQKRKEKEKIEQEIDEYILINSREHSF